MDGGTTQSIVCKRFGDETRKVVGILFQGGGMTFRDTSDLGRMRLEHVS